MCYRVGRKWKNLRPVHVWPKIAFLLAFPSTPFPAQKQKRNVKLNTQYLLFKSIWNATFTLLSFYRHDYSLPISHQFAPYTCRSLTLTHKMVIEYAFLSQLCQCDSDMLAMHAVFVNS